MEAQNFIRSWPSLWLWMHFPSEQLIGRTLGLTYTYRKGRLDIQFLDGENIMLLSWEKKGNQVIITASQSPSLPRKRVEVLRKIPANSMVRGVSIHSQDKLLKLDLGNENYFILGAYPGTNNVYYLSDELVQDSFLKNDKFPAIEDKWLSPTDSLPQLIPGGRVTHTQLMNAKSGLSVDWNNSTINFGPTIAGMTMNISELVIDVLKNANKPRQTTAASLQKTARTVLKRWKYT